MPMNHESLTPLVKITQHNIALLFANYLNSQKITAQLVQHSDGYSIYCQPSQLELAKELFEQFIKHPYDDKYQQAAWQSAEISKVNQEGSELFTNFSQQFLAHAGFVTLAVFLLSWLVFIGSTVGFGKQIFLQLHFYQQLSFAHFISEPQRLLGPVFFHFSWLHIIFNTMWWWQLGGSVERVLGKMALINLLLITAIISNIGQFIVSGPNFGGLSGVVYGLVGYVWWYGWLDPKKGLFLSKPIIGFLLFWLLLGYTNILPVNLANTAHLLGLVSGCLLAASNVLFFGRR